MNPLICIAGVLILTGFYVLIFSLARIAGKCDDEEGTR